MPSAAVRPAWTNGEMHSARHSAEQPIDERVLGDDQRDQRVSVTVILIGERVPA